MPKGYCRCHIKFFIIQLNIIHIELQFGTIFHPWFWPGENSSIIHETLFRIYCEIAQSLWHVIRLHKENSFMQILYRAARSVHTGIVIHVGTASLRIWYINYILYNVILIFIYLYYIKEEQSRICSQICKKVIGELSSSMQNLKILYNQLRILISWKLKSMHQILKCIFPTMVTLFSKRI